MIRYFLMFLQKGEVLRGDRIVSTAYEVRLYIHAGKSLF